MLFVLTILYYAIFNYVSYVDLFSPAFCKRDVIKSAVVSHERLMHTRREGGK